MTRFLSEYNFLVMYNEVFNQILSIKLLLLEVENIKLIKIFKLRRHCWTGFQCLHCTYQGLKFARSSWRHYAICDQLRCVYWYVTGDKRQLCVTPCFILLFNDHAKIFYIHLHYNFCRVVARHLSRSGKRTLRKCYSNVLKTSQTIITFLFMIMTNTNFFQFSNIFSFNFKNINLQFQQRIKNIRKECSIRR